MKDWLNIRLMKGRLGYSKDFDGVQNMAKRLEKDGGLLQQDRMIRDKYVSFRDALKSTYQGAYVKKSDSAERPVRALINPNKLKMDYDEKTISIDFYHDFKVGDVFYWENTKTYWLIYLQDLTELAYFRGDARKCPYEIFWEENGKRQSTFAAVRGPVETKIDSITKLKKSIDIPNYSLEILIPKNEHTLKNFKRYTRFYLQDVGVEESATCWRVEAVNSISVPGIIELTAIEYYVNETEDNIEDGIVDGLKSTVIDPNTEEKIKGQTFIKPKCVYNYVYQGTETANWDFDKSLPIVYDIVDDKTIKIKWNSTFSGSFVLGCNDTKKTILVESLF